MWTPLSFSFPQHQHAQIVFTNSFIYPVIIKDIQNSCGKEYATSNSEAVIDGVATDTSSFCDVQEGSEDEAPVFDYLDDNPEYNRRSLPSYGNQFYVPGYPASELVAASTASLPIFAPVDPTTHSSPFSSLDGAQPYAIYVIPIVLFSVMFITVVVLSVRYRRIKRPRRLAIEPPHMDPEKMGTLRSTPLGIFMPEDDPFTSYSNASSGPGEPSRPVPVFMPSETGSSHSRRSTIRQSRSYTYTMPTTRRSKRRPKVPKAQSASTFGSSTRRLSAERIRPPLPAARTLSRSASRRTVDSAQTYQEPQAGKEEDQAPTACLGGAEMEFGEDIPLNTPQPADLMGQRKPPKTSENNGPSHSGFWEKA